MALCLAFMQASLLSMYDAPISTEAQDLFKSSSSKAGPQFIALDVPSLLLGPFAGCLVDRYGLKSAAVVGFAWMVPAHILLRLPSEQLLEASDVVQRYDKANPGFFGDNGQCAQLYGFNSLFFCGGLVVGPILGGTLRDAVRYSNMNLILL
ncbi:hypothetical protein F5Y16DRAFT_423023 [Xylariaceae sp. FL0255]|nr:hypothetical protein F5Y16DRAFT_423023 [Xylariaceae sp. FL0255]